MGRFLGQLSTDAFGITIPELKVGLIDFGKPALADDDGILDDAATDTTNATSYPNDTTTDFLAQPDIPRGLKFKPSAEADAGNIVVEGLDYEGTPVKEEVATNGASAVTSTYAFKKVTKITFPKDDGGITWDVGWNDKLGLPYKFASKPPVQEYDDGTLQTTAGTLVVDADKLAKNTYDPNGTLDGDSEIKLVVFL